MVSPSTIQRHEFSKGIHATFLYPTARLPPPFRCSGGDYRWVVCCKKKKEHTRYFQLSVSARTMRVCTVCSERWDTAEGGGGDYRRVVCCTKIKEHTYRGYHLPWRKNKGKKKKEKKNRKKKVVPSIELANFDWIV